MITIIPSSVTPHQSVISEFLKSLVGNASKEAQYEIVDTNIPHECTVDFFDTVNFTSIPSPESKISITLPNDCVVLGPSWDKYLEYAIEHGGVIDAEFIRKRMNLVHRRPGAIHPEIVIATT